MVKLVWVYESENDSDNDSDNDNDSDGDNGDDSDNDGDSNNGGKMIFGNRKDALIFAYHRIYKKLLSYHSMYKSSKLNMPKSDWPLTPRECAKYLRQMADELYGVDDHLDDTDRWGNGHRIDDLDSQIGSIDISVQDSDNINWYTFGVEVAQYCVAENEKDISMIMGIKNELQNLEQHHGGHYIDPNSGVDFFKQIVQFDQETKTANKIKHDKTNVIEVIPIKNGTKIYYDEKKKIFFLQSSDPSLREYKVEI